MPYQNLGYCYPTLADAAAADASAAPVFTDAGVYTPSGIVLGESSVSITYAYYPISGGLNSMTILRQYAECSSPGPMVNLSGMTLLDVVAMSWGVILVWIGAFAFRAMRRAL